MIGGERREINEGMMHKRRERKRGGLRVSEEMSGDHHVRCHGAPLIGPMGRVSICACPRCRQESCHREAKGQYRCYAEEQESIYSHHDARLGDDCKTEGKQAEGPCQYH